MQLKKYHQETIMLKLRMYSLHHLPSEREINRTLNTIAHKSMVAYIDCNFNIRHFLEIKNRGRITLYLCVSSLDFLCIISVGSKYMS